jgi:hypothetical protein
MDAQLLQFDASTRMRWYAQMNAWGSPADLPWEVEADFKSCRDYKTRFPKWSAAIRAVSGSLTEEQKSWGWWREEQLGDFSTWSAWWVERHGVPTIDENGEPKSKVTA